MARSLLEGPACTFLDLSLGDFTAVSGAALGRALGRPGSLAFSEAVPFVDRAGGDGVGAAVHHPGIQAIGHRE